MATEATTEGVCLDFGRDGSLHASAQDLVAELRAYVSARFERLAGVCVSWCHATALTGMHDGAGAARWLEVLPCADCPGLPACPLAWGRLFPRLFQAPVPASGFCPGRRRYALIPVVQGGRFLAACKLVVGGSAPLERADAIVEALRLLVGDFLARDRRGCVAAEPAPDPIDRPVQHPKVRGALNHIEERLVDPLLSVRRIASALDINSTYLGHLFSAEVGVRMHRYIAARRIDLARQLLATTDWQIKRVAYETGHKNVDWFSRAFREHVGRTPGEYRLIARSGRPAAVELGPCTTTGRTTACP